MIIVNSEFKSSIINALENAGFPFAHNKSHFQYIGHDTIDGLRVQYREFHGRIKIEISGFTINSVRNVEYDENDTKALTNLKSRLARIIKKEYDVFHSRENRKNSNISKKQEMVVQIQNFNDTVGGHSNVVDPDSLEDEYGSLSCYYRSYEFNVNLDPEGLVYTRQSILNKPAQDLSMSQITNIVKALENDFS